MAMSSELRTLFVDSTEAQRQSDGSFRIILREQMEVAIDNVLYLDDLSVCGQLPMVSNHSSKVYVIEQTPKNFDYLPFKPKLPDGTELTIQKFTPPQEAEYQDFKYMTDLPKSFFHPTQALLIWYPDDTECTFVGRIYHGQTSASFDKTGNFDEVSGRYVYTSGACVWSPRMPSALSPWNFGPLSPATDSILTMRVLSLPFGDYTAQTMRQQLEASLNDLSLIHI